LDDLYQQDLRWRKKARQKMIKEIVTPSMHYTGRKNRAEPTVHTAVEWNDTGDLDRLKQF